MENLKGAKITGFETKLTYDGEKAAIPANVTLSNNINKGTAAAVLKGISTYSGTKTFKFKISAKQMQIDGKTDWENILDLIKGFMRF